MLYSSVVVELELFVKVAKDHQDVREERQEWVDVVKSVVGVE